MGNIASIKTSPKDVVEKRKEYVDEIFKKNRKYRYDNPVPLVYRTDGSFAGWAVKDQKVDADYAAGKVREILIYNPLRNEEYTEKLERVYGQGRKQSTVVFEDEGNLLITSRIEKRGDDADDSNFKYLIEGSQADRVKEKVREARNAWDAVDRLKDKLEQDRKQKERAQKELENAKKTSKELRGRVHELSKKLSETRTALDQMRAKASEGEARRQMEASKEREKIDNARQKGTYEGKTTKGKLNEELRSLRELKTSLAGIFGQEQNEEILQKIDNLMQEVNEFQSEQGQNSNQPTASPEYKGTEEGGE